jgi:hypothetical protein
LKRQTKRILKHLHVLTIPFDRFAKALANLKEIPDFAKTCKTYM